MSLLSKLKWIRDFFHLKVKSNVIPVEPPPQDKQVTQERKPMPGDPEEGPKDLPTEPATLEPVTLESEIEPPVVLPLAEQLEIQKTKVIRESLVESDEKVLVGSDPAGMSEREKYEYSRLKELVKVGRLGINNKKGLLELMRLVSRMK